jgi:hypothetical protein
MPALRAFPLDHPLLVLKLGFRPTHVLINAKALQASVR